MRRNLLLSLALFAVMCVGVQASITTAEQTDPERIINGGYSEAAAEEVVIMKNRIMGQPCEPLYEQKHNKFVRFLRNCYSYIDPSQDNDERYHHDVKMSPHHSDL